MAYKNNADPRWKISRLKHYYNNKEQYIARNKIVKSRIMDFVHSIKSKVPCADCNIIYPYYVMDFDHIPNDKSANISLIFSWNVLFKELVKCELVCSNCHRERTYQRKNLV